MQLEYLQFDPNHITKFPLFLIHGKEVILRNEIKDKINSFFGYNCISNVNLKIVQPEIKQQNQQFPKNKKP